MYHQDESRERKLMARPVEVHRGDKGFDWVLEADEEALMPAKECGVRIICQPDVLEEFAGRWRRRYPIDPKDITDSGKVTEIVSRKLPIDITEAQAVAEEIRLHTAHNVIVRILGQDYTVFDQGKALVEIDVKALGGLDLSSGT